MAKEMLQVKNPAAGSLVWFQGMFLASIFSLVYILTPLYLIACLVSFGLLPTKHALLFCVPLLLSIAIPSMPAPRLVGMMTPMLTYFQYEEAFEYTDEDIRKDVKAGKKVILAFVPHGIISFCSLCAAVNSPPELRKVQTAVASSLLQTPILKNVMGIFNLVSATKSSLKNKFKKDGIDGSVVLYVGGIAELFKACPEEERLFLSKRKGFIKLALQEGVDVVPGYLFGNTSVLMVFKHGPLAALSRSLGVALTYFWGKYYLPIPRDVKVLYVRGKPLGLPHIPEPTNEDIDKWHKKYCDEIRRLFETNKEKVPLYKHKTLFID